MVKTNVISKLASSNAPSLSADDIRAIKAPIPIANPWILVCCAAALLLLALLAWWFWRKRRRQASSPVPEVVISPYEKVRAKLEEALALLDQPRPFCILVSDAVRVYLEERFQLRAPERTTEEFLEELQSSALLTCDHKRSLGEFLTACDLVKFARYEPGRMELQAIYDAALGLVDETRPPPPQPAGEIAASSPAL